MMKANRGILWLFQQKKLMSSDECWKFLQSFTEENIPALNVDIPLKHSQYTLVKQKDRTYVLYNTLYNSMITVSDDEFQQYQSMYFKDICLVKTLVESGFIIPQYTNEFERYCYYQNALQNVYPFQAHYTVTLTSRCNAKCIYCYEEGIERKDMLWDTAGKFADILLHTDKEIDITWFGGEPLLKTDIIDYISSVLNQNGKAFSSGIITNGSLLNQEIITQKFKLWHISWVQITIDGMAEEYVKRKRYGNRNEDFFKKVTDNIRLLLDNSVEVSIRLNMDFANSEECIRAAEYFKQQYPDNPYLDVYPAFLSGNSHSIEDVCQRSHYAKAIYKMYNPYSNMFWFQPKIDACFFNQPGAFVIDTDGSILCCDRDIGKQSTKIGSVYDIETFDELQKPNSVISPVRKNCETCVYYPKCGGGCRATYESDCQYDACFMERYKIEFLMDKIMGYA